MQTTGPESGTTAATPRKTSSERVPLAPLLVLAAYTFYAQMLPMFVRPFVAREFGLDAAAMSFLEGLAAVGALGTFWLARRADRHGRRSAILTTTLCGTAAALTTGLAPTVVVFMIAGTALRACVTALQMVLSVALSEEARDELRARLQSYFGLVAGVGGLTAVVLSGALEDVAGGWRWMYGVAALPALALPFVRRSLPETKRFTRAQVRGATESSRARDLFQPLYRRRAIGLLLAGTLRPIGIVALGGWAFYHAVENLGIPAAQVAWIYVGGAMSMLGNPVGAWMANRWGRKPTLVFNVATMLVAGVAYFWIPGDQGLLTVLGLGVTFAGFAFASQAFAVANRLLDSECFPTHLRATYTGANAMGEAIGTVTSYLALSGLLAWVGDLPTAITLLAGTSILASIPIFLATAPETRGLTLEEASQEDVEDVPLATAAE
jgi:MFS family permease